MKTLFALIIFVLIATTSMAGNPYRAYLLTQIHEIRQPVAYSNEKHYEEIKAIPGYEIPKGAVFCRLEDKLTRVTKVWFKIGLK